MADQPTVANKRNRKPRPSRARGLRTTTGCLTCRKRRIKCDETKPRCGPCVKSAKECEVSAGANNQDEARSTESNATQRSVVSTTASFRSPITRQSITSDVDPLLFANTPELRFDLSPLTLTTSLPSPNSAPFQWYDLLAEDAISNIHKHNLGFDELCLSRRQSPVPETPELNPLIDAQLGTDNRILSTEIPVAPWKSADRILLNDNELILLQHYVEVVGPMLDLFDPLRHFAIVIPRLAVHNVGLLKSLLAVSARHMALHRDTLSRSAESSLDAHSPGPPMLDGVPEVNGLNRLSHIATQYYYETLQYLGQNLLYPSYSRSSEIIATTILISTYEMFDSEGSYSNGAWERHLRGVFWIQRSQDNNGESKDGIRRAVWWAWVRQDIWVAFREGRRVLTIWHPKRRLSDLTPDELATRVVYIAARCVDFATNDKSYDLSIRIEQGDRLLQALDDWHRILPSSFQPIYALPPPDSELFSPIWIHPPSHAAAIQMFHFARIIVLINQPCMGGTGVFRQRQRLLDESVYYICGIAMMHQGKELLSAFVNPQALYAAGLCVQSPVKQSAILELLEKTLNVTRFPPKTLLRDLENHWRNET
ncbi:hypothetical protein K504DRAFT_488097 [Pleomassaria siparia CBS 279.74]|uniref:Zn(2)-C6 fungal-type domain-containing protein n=1 Tax=Pleomassaria siparia CBS 279.74 TaxID=1314801 RepID=A0A6G1KMR2_9PLEO|nr:hypothetical protein K504DRAFT_488097 [Pleomassaria siparia CBS 279.74]